jgi:biopolymer transport protein ExbB/TolQ
MDGYSALIVDSVLAVLLVGAIIACFIVYRRLSTIREGQDELRQLVEQLNQAAIEAQRSVSGLRSSAEEIEQRLSSERQRASVLADELAMITEAGNNLADRIEKGLTSEKRGEKQPSSGEDKASKKQQQEILAALREAR